MVELAIPEPAEADDFQDVTRLTPIRERVLLEAHGRVLEGAKWKEGTPISGQCS